MVEPLRVSLTSWELKGWERTVEPLSETENDSFSHESMRWKVNETEALPASRPFMENVFDGVGWGEAP